MSMLKAQFILYDLKKLGAEARETLNGNREGSGAEGGI